MKDQPKKKVVEEEKKVDKKPKESDEPVYKVETKKQAVPVKPKLPPTEVDEETLF